MWNACTDHTHTKVTYKLQLMSDHKNKNIFMLKSVHFLILNTWQACFDNLTFVCLDQKVPLNHTVCFILFNVIPSLRKKDIFEHGESLYPNKSNCEAYVESTLDSAFKTCTIYTYGAGITTCIWTLGIHLTEMFLFLILPLPFYILDNVMWSELWRTWY